MAATKLLSERDVRRMLELVAQVGRAERGGRWAFLLEQLRVMVEADAGMVLQVRRGKSGTRFEVLVSRGESPAVGLRASDRASYAQSIVPLEKTGHYSCVKLYRAGGFTPQQVEMTDFVWQSLGKLHSA